MTRKVLVTEPIHPAGMALLEERFDVRVATDPSLEGLMREIKDVSALLVRTAEVNAELIAAAPNLKIIARHGVGVDNVDTAAATQRSIPVTYTPEANAPSVAEHVLALMGALAKRLLQYDSATRSGHFRVRESFQAIDLQGKLLGVLGVGRIGSIVCQKAKAAFDMTVLAYDKYVPPEGVRSFGAEPVEQVDELLQASDVVTIHVPLTAETQGLISAERLRLMKPTAFLINTARGGLVDMPALVEALSQGLLAGAALDVYDQEPPNPENPLFGLPNVIVTPHSASLSVESVIRMSTDSAQAIVDVLEGRRPAAVVNPEVFG